MVNRYNVATGRKVKVTIGPGSLRGSLLIPASKSHTIRALLIATMAHGESVIRNPLDSADTRSCIDACRALGARIAESPADAAKGRPGEMRVTGTGGRIVAPARAIDVGNSGTTLYLAAGVAALGAGPITLTGDHQIQARPFAPLLAALADLGAAATAHRGNGRAPATITGPLSGGRTTIECTTSQYLSSLLLAAPLALGTSEIDVPLLNERPYAEMTLRWLDEQGVQYRNVGFKRFEVDGGQHYKPFDRAMPGDFSSATFFLCAAALTGSTLTLEGLDMEDSQGDKEVVQILERMGCIAEVNGAGLTIHGPGSGPNRAPSLRGCDIDLNSMPDALPALAVTGCFAEGTTRLLNVPQAREKETDRIAVMHRELEKMGAHVRELPDGLVIEGSPLHGARVDGHGDHRVVMALAIAGLGASGTTEIEGSEAASVTFPSFFELLNLSSL